MTTKRLLTTAVVTFMLTGCGGGAAKIGGKDGAAQAVHALSTPTQSAAKRASGGVLMTDISGDCAKGGTAKLSNFAQTVDVSGGVSFTQTFTMTLTNCGLASSSEGDALYNGTVEVSQKVVTDTSGVKVEQHFKGSVSLAGAFSDTLDTDVTESVTLTDLGKSGSVSIVLNGTVTTSTSSYTFDESVSVTGGTIAVDVAGSK
jgi:hypothetical protein